MNNWLNLFLPVNSTGYGTHGYFWGRQLVYELTIRGVNCVLIPRDGRLARTEFRTEHIDGLDGVLVDSFKLQEDMKFDAPSICLWHANDMSRFCGHPRIGYTVWETTELTPRELNHLAQLDYIAVPTEWHRQLLLEQLCVYKDLKARRDIFVWPEGVDPAYYHPPTSSMSEFTQFSDPTRYTFGNIGKWEVRKGHKPLIRAFGRIAEEYDHVRLVGLWGNPFMPEDQWLADVTRALNQAGFTRPAPGPGSSGLLRATYVKKPEVYVDIYTHFPDKEMVRELYTAIECGVFPSFAEGWGLPAMEMMAMGKPIIALKWGAPSAYLKHECFYPLTGAEAQAFDGMWFQGDRGSWCQVDEDSIVSQMKWVLGHQESAQSLGKIASDHVRENFSWKKAALKTIQDLVEIEVIDPMELKESDDPGI